MQGRAPPPPHLHPHAGPQQPPGHFQAQPHHQQPPPPPHAHPQHHHHHPEPIPRHARMITGHMAQAGGGSMGTSMSMGLRIQCPQPRQPQPISLMPPRPRLPPPAPMHRPPPMHHHMQHSQMPPPMTSSVSQPQPIITSNNNLTSNNMTVSSQAPPVSSGAASYAPKPSSTTNKEEITKTEIKPTEITNTVTNGIEKTPMCLVNELARFNKIQHQYRLTSEQGPAHRRRFTVALRLGGGDKERVEEYTAEAPKIRLAQHAVAAEALRCTKYPLPPPRPPKTQRKQRRPDTIIPTVELNALVMKLGEPAIYKIENQPAIVPPIRNGPAFQMSSRPRMNHPPLGPNHPILGPQQTQPPMHMQQFNRNGRFYSQNRFTYPYKFPNNGYRENISPENMFRVELTVGKRVYHGKGVTVLAARNDAASQALQELRQVDKENSESEAIKTIGNEKSPVSMVHEMALKLEYPASFSVKSEKGPPHMKVFTTTCTVGEYTTEGEGNSKKISKKRAAENMLEILKKLPSYKEQPVVPKPQRKTQMPKKKTKKLIKEKCDSVSLSEQNPVSRLLQWANHKNGGGGVEPVYTLKEENHAQYRRNFVIECVVAGHTTTGSGTNKKIAKRNAAETMLIELGLGETVNAGTTAKTLSETSTEKHETSKSPRKVTFSLDPPTKPVNENVTSNTTGRQLVPGVLLMQDHLASVGNHFKTPTKNGVTIQTTATIAKELLRAGTSPTAEALVKNDQQIGMSNNSKPISSSVVSSTTSGNVGPSQISQVIRPKDQLLYLAQLLGFQVQFSDFPKGNHGEYLSLVTLSTEPPMLCHGGGLTTEESHDQSARAALEHLSQLGLDNVTPHQSVSSSHPGDGIRMLNTNNGAISGILTNGISK